VDSGVAVKVYSIALPSVKIDRTLMSDEKRPYRKKQRAELEQQTRRRITESAAELHGTLGPARTSISAVAEHAGVRRSTVYRHFPDEAALFAACSAHWRTLNPPPDLTAWAAIEDPRERLRAGLEQMYAFYRRTELMMENLHRDEATMPTVKQTFSQFRGYISAARETLMGGWQARGRRRQHVRAAIGHALVFPTWRSLTREQGLDDPQAVELMCRLAAAAADGPDNRS
jgi:AcrR family transcriptional regulator